MSRRSTPERIDAARRAAVRNSLIGEGATEETADAWIAAWEGQARLAADEGVAEPDVIDLALRLGAGHPHGPFGYQTPPT